MKKILSLTIIMSGLMANQAPMPTDKEISDRMIFVKKEKKMRPMVGVCLKRIAIQMAADLDADAESNKYTAVEAVH